jgi:hypothetical protein
LVVGTLGVLEAFGHEERHEEGVDGIPCPRGLVQDYVFRRAHPQGTEPGVDPFGIRLHDRPMSLWN